jgi:fructosamine-3-kinase
MNHLPEPLCGPVSDMLRGLGDSSAIHSARPVSGGCINNAMRLETDRDRYLLKWNADPLPDLFLCEARGLEAIAATHTVRVPVVLGLSEGNDDHPAFILLEFLEGLGPGDVARLGEQVAEMHRRGVSPQNPPAYGLGYDNYVGSPRQINGWEQDWPTFFANSRLRPQMQFAQETGHLTPIRRRKLERLIERLPDLLSGVERRPALIHGDLWSGNIIPGPDGLALIDPSISYSDREAEIAYTQMFEPFSARFYEAYQATWPLNPGYPERRDLYNLYPLLNHLNLFGESYGYRVDEILNRMVS